MAIPFKIKTIALLTFLMSGVYFCLLSRSGILEKSDLEARLRVLKLDVERLENENASLEAKHKLLKNDDVALAMEARKYYLLSENANVLKFRETAGKPSAETVLASRFTNISPFKVKQIKSPVPPMSIFRFFYITAGIFICIGVFIKLKK
ncbi:MAG: septum formation initiator family protein [Leptospira sp.]|nr:septum formation initiator family protein [Leptospira sp.]